VPAEAKEGKKNLCGFGGRLGSTWGRPLIKYHGRTIKKGKRGSPTFWGKNGKTAGSEPHSMQDKPTDWREGGFAAGYKTGKKGVEGSQPDRFMRGRAGTSFGKGQPQPKVQTEGRLEEGKKTSYQ